VAVTTAQWRRNVARILETTLPRRAKQIITTAAVELESEVKANQKRAGLGRRTGALFNRTSARAKFGLSTLESEIELTVDVPYARVHEGPKPTVIKAKRSRYLTIPLDAAKTQDRAQGATRASARQWPNTYVRRSKAGNLIIWSQNGEPLFLLRRQVTIRPRPYVAPAILKIRKSLRADLAGMLRDVIEEAGRG